MSTRYAIRSDVFLGALIVLVAAAPPAQGQRPSGAPDDPLAYFDDYERAAALYEQRRYADAAPLLAELTRRHPSDAQTWFRLARSEEETGRAAAAVLAYRESVERGYRYTAWVSYRIARLHAGLGEPDSAMTWLERSLAARWDDRPGIASDPAFKALRGDRRFRQITGLPVDREAMTRDEGWRYDLAYLVEEAKRMHAGPDRPAFTAAFDSATATLHDRIPRLSNERILIEMQRLVALLGDGHSGIYGPDPDSPLRFDAGSLPMLFYLFDDGLHVVDAFGDARRWIGSRVVRFGPRTTREALDALTGFTHHDNPMTVRWLGVRFHLPSLAFLHAIGATDDPARAMLTLRDADGQEHSVTLEGGNYVRRFRRKLRPPPNSSGRPPLYLRRVDTNYWLEPLPDHDALYFQFNQVRDMEDGPSIEQFADSLRHALERTGANALIIDVRHNNGGNNGLLTPLVRALVWWETDSPGRRIFVITGRNTFSAAQNFINRVERYTDAVFVGEPSSSRPNFAGEETNLLLPWSRVRGSISTLYWQDSDPDDRRRWIAPHLPVSLSADDYFANRDPALEAVLAAIAPARRRADAHP